MQYQVYWTPQTQLLELQGATVDFRARDDVYYENYFLPSGRTIVSWQSQHSSQNQRLADLPQLLRGETYAFIKHIDNSERMFAYLTVTFYDDQYQTLMTTSQNKDEVVIKVPNNYAFYTIDLVSAGVGSFIFHNIAIRPQKKGILRDDDQRIAPNIYSYIEIPAKITSKTLRVIFSEPEDQVTDYMSDWVKETQQAVQYITSSAINARYYRQDEQAVTMAIKQARKQVHARRVEFIGYGPISSYAALYYQSQFKGSLATISEDVNLVPAPDLRLERAVTGVNYLSNPIAPNYTLAVQVIRPKYERLDMLTYETPTPEEVRLQAAYDATHPKKNAVARFFTANKK